MDNDNRYNVRSNDNERISNSDNKNDNDKGNVIVTMIIMIVRLTLRISVPSRFIAYVLSFAKAHKDKNGYNTEKYNININR